MKNNYKILLAGILIFILILGYFLFFNQKEDYTEIEKIEIAKSLTTNGVVMYGLDTCSHCKEQKELFGNAFQFINYKRCEENILECSKLKGVPAWIINNETYYGLKSIDELKSLVEAD